MRKIYIFLSFLLCSLTLNYFLYSNNLIDIITNRTVSFFNIQWPVERLFIEPFYAFAYYILTMERSGYIFALVAWALWIVIFAASVSRYKKMSLRQTLVNSFAGVLLFVSAVMAVILLPVPGPNLSNTDS
ncbi:MAG: hypothetical protein PHN29_04345 [Endomicrobiaceae bacterium]|nr:hypothetical protein [Endomicrobiaceae bacterium]